MKAECVWEGKYDEHGRRREVDVGGCAAPLLKTDEIDGPQGEPIGKRRGRRRRDAPRDDFRNMLIWGDNKAVMAGLLDGFQGAVDLIYVDPPFGVGADFRMDVPIGAKDADRPVVEMLAYRDVWGRGAESYLHMMVERFFLFRELLSDRGTLYVHCDYRVSAHFRLMLDEVFGEDRFQNHIVWAYKTGGVPGRIGFARKHDDILVFAKSAAPTFNPLDQKSYVPTLPEPHTPSGKRLRVRRDTVCDLCGVGRPGQKYRMVRARDVWDDIQSIFRNDEQSTGYVTQKPEALLRRIIEASSNEGDLVADFFCGSGTTGAVAEQLGRRWIMADVGRLAVHTSRKRLIDLQCRLHAEGRPARAFDVWRVGGKRRGRCTHTGEDGRRRALLESFKAEVLTRSPSPLIHGRKGGSFCHVGAAGSVLTPGEARIVAKAVAQAGGREVYCLAWGFDVDFRRRTARIEEKLGVKVRPVLILRETVGGHDGSAWFEAPMVEAEAVHRDGRDGGVDLRLTEFVPLLVECENAELRALVEEARGDLDFVDLWAVDFDWRKGGAFRYHWQDHRLRKGRALKRESDAGFVYPRSGRHVACVMVADTFGCDTRITVEVKA